jgi:hypothetical protein
MAGFTDSVFVPNVSPEAAFDFATYPRHAHLITANIKGQELVTPGPLAAGSRLREVRVMNGKEETVELEVRAYDRPSRYVVGAAVSGIDVEYAFAYRRENDGTRIDLACTVHGSGLKTMMAPVVAAVMKREDGDLLARIRDALIKSHAA